MKKQLITSALLICLSLCSQMAFSQNKNDGSSQEQQKIFSHTIQTQVGYRCIDGFMGDYNILTNLIPSYELGYKNKYFAKLSYITFFEDYSGFIYLTDYNVYQTVKNTRFNFFSLVLSYNLLNCQSKHILKAGLDLGYGFNNVLYDGNKRNYYHYYGLGGELTYKYFLTKNIGIGAELNYGYVYRKDIELPKIGINLTFSYRL